MSKSPWSIRRPAPLLGQHTEEVLVELGYTKADIARLRELKRGLRRLSCPGFRWRV